MPIKGLTPVPKVRVNLYLKISIVGAIGAECPFSHNSVVELRSRDPTPFCTTLENVIVCQLLLCYLCFFLLIFGHLLNYLNCVNPIYQISYDSLTIFGLHKNLKKILKKYLRGL